MAFKAELSFGDSKMKYIVLECEYEFHQNIDESGQPCSRPKGGIISVVVESISDKELVTWMLKTSNVRSGQIVFYSKDNATKMKTLGFKNAYCIRLREKFSHTGDSPMITSFSFTAKEISLDDETYSSLWGDI